ncbi:MAG TPA: FxLYD domain-containing protein [Anaerolineae bacterium]|nr:FxLYD domain-containing protein [Anaerolineae bacterium]
MKELALAFILTTLFLVTSGCQKRGATPQVAREGPSPAPTPEIGVTFATLTPGPKATGGTNSTAVLTRPAPTVTATAAPVTYVVQSGDTLVDIAAANGVTLSELLALNPDIQPELLMIGQQILLPPLPTIEPPEILATNQAITLEISGPTIYGSVGGGVWVLGEVRNAGSHTVELIQVEVILLDQDEAILAEEMVWVTPVTLPTGGKAPFGLLFPMFDAAQTTARVALAAGRPAYELGSRYLDLAVSGAEVTIGRNPIEVTGQLDNVGGQTAGQISIITTFYDDQGNVTGFHEKRLDSALAPGENVPFRFVALPPGGRADAYSFATQAVVVE